MNDTMFPRFQYSIFDKNLGDAQWVVRGNDWDEFLKDVEEVKAKVTENLAKVDPIEAVTQNVNTHPCKICGGFTEFKTGTSAKTGKEWRGYFCKNNKDHVQWLPPKSE
jgi:hypothetical protein